MKRIHKEDVKQFLEKPQLKLFWVGLLFVVVAVSPVLDIAVSRMFYHDGHFYFQSGAAAWLIELGIPALLGLLGLVMLGLWIAGKLRCRPVAGVDTRAMLLTFGTMVLGPGLIVNGLFKTFWGRARPYEISQFGGERLFTPPMVIADQCSRDCSFMSGHTAIGFWIICFALLLPRRYRKASIAAALTAGAVLGAARIAQGMHFFSDVVFAGVIIVAVVVWCHYRLYPEEYHK